MISLAEANELHMLVGVALENSRDGVIPTITDLERAREIAALLVSDLSEE